MSDLFGKPSDHLIENFVWKTAEGKLLKPKYMDSHHITNCVRMIWNHICPEEMRFKPHVEYKFPALYNQKYMSEAISCFFHELKIRDGELPTETIDLVNEMFRRVCEFEHKGFHVKPLNNKGGVND